MKNKLRLIALAILIFGAAFVRLYRISATQTFLEDEGRDMLIAHRMLDTKRPVLLGPQTSTGNMYLGPFYYYFITPALAISGGDPVGPAIYIALTGVLTVWLLYVVGKRLFGEQAGWVAATMYAFLPYPIYFTRNSWNPNLVPLVMLLIIWVGSKLELKTLSKQILYYLFAFGVLTGVLLQLHYMALVGVGSVGVWIIAHNWRSAKNLPASLLVGLSGIILMMSPFIAFEVRNNYVNSKALVGFVSGQENKNIRYDLTFGDWERKIVSTFGNLASVQLGIQTYIVESWRPFLMIVLLLVTLSLLAKKSDNSPRANYLLFAIIVVSFIILGFYQENIHGHYVGYFLPVIYLAFGYATSLPRVGKLFIVALAAIFIHTTPILIGYLGSGPNFQVAKAREVAAYIGHAAGSTPYNVVSRAGGQTAPYQYFLALLPNRPSNTLETKLYIICEGTPCNVDDETTTLLYLTGPSHPSIAEYLGHPQVNEFRNPRTMISNEHVSHGLWVAEITVEKQ